MISPSNTYPGLTKAADYNASNEPDVYYPNCTRNYTRVAPTDDLQGAAAAQLARQLRKTRVYLLDDGDLYGRSVAEVFAATARQLGIQVVGGPEAVDPTASDYGGLGQKVSQTVPDFVYWGGYEN